MGYKYSDSCLAKVTANEPIFVLRAQDKLAPEVIRFWVQLARQYGDPTTTKIDEALDCARAMEAWPTRKYPD